eukprot:9697085-Ditylum_brightwellii.AAC.1
MPLEVCLAVEVPHMEGIGVDAFTGALGDDADGGPKLGSLGLCFLSDGHNLDLNNSFTLSQLAESHQNLALSL